MPTVEVCATDHLTLEEKYQLAQAVHAWESSTASSHRTLLNNKETIDIPTYFHILQYDEQVGSLKRRSIFDGFMGTLNKAYAATPFRFRLKKVSRTIAPEFHNCSKGFIEYSFKSELRRGGRNALNVYVCNAYGYGVSGWSTYPLAAITEGMDVMDGVVVQNPELYGTHLSSYYSLVHEVGHFLGLLHTFGTW